MNENPVRPDIRVDRETWDKVKAYAFLAHMPVGAIVLEAIHLWIEVYASNSDKYTELADAVRNRLEIQNARRAVPSDR